MPKARLSWAWTWACPLCDATNYHQAKTDRQTYEQSPNGVNAGNSYLLIPDEVRCVQCERRFETVEPVGIVGDEE